MVKYRLPLVLASLVIAGCSGFQEFEYRWHLRDHAKDAWKAAGIVGTGPDYEDGWKAGYFDLSMGSNGQTPPVPPKKYWGRKYQTPTGQQYILDWYSGYQDGVISAEQAGEFEWHLVPSSGVASLPTTSGGETHVYDDILPESEYDLPEPTPAAPATSAYRHSPPNAPQHSNTAIAASSQPAVDLRMFSGRPASSVSEELGGGQLNRQAFPASLAQRTNHEHVSLPNDQSLVAANDSFKSVVRLREVDSLQWFVTEKVESHEIETANNDVKPLVVRAAIIAEPREVQPNAAVMSARPPMPESTTTRR